MKPLAVCAIFKNEGPFLLEWIAYHRAQGFDYFVLYDNDSTDGGADVVRSSSLSRHCKIIHWPYRPGQLSAYRDFIQSSATSFEWVAFIDLDEFVLPLGATGIRELLQSWSGFSAVLLSWRIFGPSGWVERPEGLVIENYNMRSSDEMPVNHHIKSIVKCDDLVDITKNPHEFVVKGAVCNTVGRVVSNIAIQPEPCHENLVLNHYATRSRHDWIAKINRGSAMFDYTRPKYKEEMFDHFAEISHIRDETIKKWIPKVREILEAPAVQIDVGHVARAVSHAQSRDMEVSYELVRLDPGLFSLTLGTGPSASKLGLPAARVSLPPGPGDARQTVSVSTFRGDGWLTADDEPALIRVTSGSAEVLVTVYWNSAHGAGPKPRLQWTRLDTGLKGIPEIGMDVPAASAPAGNAEILAHIQDRGDVEGKLGEWIGQPRSGRWIEGFRVAPMHGVGYDEIQYRAVLGPDWLSPWLNGGSFCGSRGLALPLRGFCLRLLGAAAAKYDCSYSARFVDGAEIGPGASGQVCAVATMSPLEAFQIVLRPRGG